MKKLAILMLAVVLGSCNKEKDDDQNPSPSILSQMQAPFGSDTVQVKLRQVVSDGQLIGEFNYKDGFVSEHKQFLKFYVKKANWAIEYFKRASSLPLSNERLVAEFVPEYQYLSEEMLPVRTISFDTPKTDSTREVSENYVSINDIYLKKYFFDKKGQVVKLKVTKKNVPSNEILTTYLRNDSDNIIQSSESAVSDAKATVQTTYEYDNHPNPFYKMGTDWTGYLSIHVFSPNNITKMNITKSDGTKGVTIFTYDYNTNGYPSKLLIDGDGLRFPDEPYALDFVY
ncbi:hypothetical protein [Dyadobacter sp. 3J3]|uniref:hypothetical protein n=1 Tax=Dyadobacter sp. 3J3 TaxID=2606600 RepID=UPI00135A2C8C|nr:hypothetical protein [Dyadobacter sp. 3J3]